MLNEQKLSLAFESSVILQISKTTPYYDEYRMQFESSVILQISKTGR